MNPPESPTPSHMSPPTEIRRQRRTTVIVAVVVAVILVLLFLFLTRPSTPNSQARQVKNAVFGPRITSAVERSLRDSEGSGESSSSSRRSGESSGGRRESDSGSDSETGQSQNEDGDNRQSREGTDSPANYRRATQSDSGSDAPPERSIGWLDRFYGDDSDEPTRPGEGGVTTNAGSGESARPPNQPPTEPVASEFRRTDAAPENPNTPEGPPARTTNSPTRRPPPTPSAALNDNLERLLRQHRAGTGDVRISLMWSNRNDLDLHVVDPSGTEIFFQNRSSRTGGTLDIDMNAGMPLRSPAVENVFWPVRSAPAGAYRILVNHFRQHDAISETQFTVRVLIRGRTTDFRGTIRHGEPMRLVHEFNLAP